jgi:hypothetical protein
MTSYVAAGKKWKSEYLAAIGRFFPANRKEWRLDKSLTFRGLNFLFLMAKWQF